MNGEPTPRRTGAARRGRCPLFPVSFAMLALLLAGSGCEDTRFRVRTPPGERLDVFQQTAVPTIDVLWVVDNSASMAEEQQALADNFTYFFDYLDATGADFHIGVISTDVYSDGHRGRLLGRIPIISRATPNTAAVFAENVLVGTDGKGDEQGFAAAEAALGEPLISGPNAGFLRPDAFLFLIFVSDEDDRSFGEVPYYLRRFEQIKGIGNDGMVNIAAVVEIEPGSCPDAEPGERYGALAETAGGLVASICEPDFAANLDALGFSAAGLKRSFALSEAAKPASLAVWVKTQCAAEPPPEDICETVYDDCRGDNELYGHSCVVRRALPDGWAYEEDTASIRFYGRAVPPFGAIIEAGYIPDVETF